MSELHNVPPVAHPTDEKHSHLKNELVEPINAAIRMALTSPVLIEATMHALEKRKKEINSPVNIDGDVIRTSILVSLLSRCAEMLVIDGHPTMIANAIEETVLFQMCHSVKEALR